MTNYNESWIFLIASTVRTQLKSCYFCIEVFTYDVDSNLKVYHP